MSQLVDHARRIAQSHLEASRPMRWQHVTAVAALAERLAVALDAPSRETVVTAAWLHDIGRAPGVRDTGFRALDAARFLTATKRFPAEVIALVAHHGSAASEAIEHGLHRHLARFRRPDPTTLALLSAADLCTDPVGDLVTPAERIGGILHRYAPSHPVHRGVDRCGPAMLAQAELILSAAIGRPDCNATYLPEQVVANGDGWHAYWPADLELISAVRHDGAGTVLLDPKVQDRGNVSELLEVAIAAARGEPLNWVQYRAQPRTGGRDAAPAVETFDFRGIVTTTEAHAGLVVAQRVFRALDDVTEWQRLRPPSRRGLAALRAPSPPICRPA